MTTINTLQSELITVAKGIKSANVAVANAQAKRAGFYNGAVSVAATANSADQLEKAFDGLFAAIQTDGRLAVSVGAKKRKKPTKDGKTYTVPASLQVAKSTLLGAMRLGVSFTDDDGETRSFGEIRKLKAEAEAELAASEATEEERLIVEISEVCTRLTEGLTDFSADQLKNVLTRVNDIVGEIEAANAQQDALDDIAQAA